MSDYKSIAAEFNIQTPEKIEFQDLILLVEHQNDVRLILAHHLNKIGYKQIKQCSDGHEAVQWLKTAPRAVALTIAAMDMPLLGGIELLNEIRDQEDLVRGPFVITMNSPDKNKIMLATENSVDSILVKPFSFNEIVPKIKQAFRVFHNPQNPEMVYEYAKKALKDGRLDEAEAIYQRLLTVTSKAARPVLGLASIALKREATEQALKLLDEAQQRNPHYVPIYVQRGKILIKRSQHQEAIAAFKEAINLSPLNPIRYEEVAQVLFVLQKFDEAIEVLNIALKNDLSFPGLHHYLSQSYFHLKDYRKAVFHIRHALSVEPENVTYLNQLGISYKESDQFPEALKTYNQIIKVDPDNKAALYNKAILLYNHKKADEAIKLLQRCVAKHPDFAAAKMKLDEYQKHQKAG
ncbi:MAG: tetratricopeptide repeat protein [Oligoflexus sp.]